MTSEPPSTTPKSSPSKKESDATVEAVNHLIQGKRHLLVQDISSAVNSLQEACGILAACYGELANECGDAYYHYGIALLELSRKESGVFGNQKEGSCSEDDDDDDDADDDDDEEDEEDDEQKTDDDEEDDDDEGKTTEDSEAKSEDLEDSKKADEGMESENKENIPADTSSHADASNVSVVEKPNVETCDSKTPSSTAGPSTSTDLSQPSNSQDKSKTKEGEEEDISSLQVAWEVLELAKVIFKRQAVNNSEMQLRLAQVHSKLGEVAMESENYKQSIEDLLECFNIQHSLLPTDDRHLAEVYYQMGLAYCFDLQFDSSIESFKNAVKILKDRINNLQDVVVTKEKPEENDVTNNAKKEIEELNSLIPEILEKITDTEDLKKNSLKLNLPEELNKGLVPEQCQEEPTVDSTTSPVKIAKPITNIGHLVRKKRKPEESGIDASAGDFESKRSRSEKEGIKADTAFLAAESQVNGTAMECNSETKTLDDVHSTQPETCTTSGL